MVHHRADGGASIHAAQNSEQGGSALRHRGALCTATTTTPAAAAAAATESVRYCIECGARPSAAQQRVLWCIAVAPGICWGQGMNLVYGTVQHMCCVCAVVRCRAWRKKGMGLMFSQSTHAREMGNKHPTTTSPSSLCPSHSVPLSFSPSLRRLRR